MSKETCPAKRYEQWLKELGVGDVVAIKHYTNKVKTFARWTMGQVFEVDRCDARVDVIASGHISSYSTIDGTLHHNGLPSVEQILPLNDEVSRKMRRDIAYEILVECVDLLGISFENDPDIDRVSETDIVDIVHQVNGLREQLTSKK